jgi:hypothetical protein
MTVAQAKQNGFAWRMATYRYRMDSGASCANRIIS